VSPEDRVAAPSATTLSAERTSAPAHEPLVGRPASPIRDPERYAILGEHGRGGLGRVSRARDLELGRDIAIKELLSRGHVNELRFVREAMITARLEHPGIVPVHEAGRWPDGTPFYAMKLVSGRPLRALIAERTTVDERIALLHHVIAVADAIAYAHGRKIIHRDLKPANVIVGDYGETVVIDWGLAKDLSEQSDLDRDGASDASGSNDDQLTRAGSVLGTPAYMPPEQERGDRVDQRADVFAIGAMLWELCSLHKVPPTDLTTRHRLLREAGIDSDLAAIINKALEPDRRRRYADAGALAADLKAFKSGARINARRYSLAAMLAHWTRRHRALAISGIAFVMLLISSVAALAVLYRSSTHHAGEAQLLLTKSYVEQGRRALLDGKHAEALAYFVHAAHRGDDSTGLRFMMERAAEPLEAEMLRLQGASSRTWSAVFSQDGQQILTADDTSGRVWDAKTGELRFTLPHTATVFQAFYSPDQATIATVSQDRSVKLWSARTGVLVRTLTPGTGELDGLRRGAISPDGRLVAARGVYSTVTHVWDSSTGVEVASLPNVSNRWAALAFSQDGAWLATTGGAEVSVFDTRTWEPTSVLPTTQVRGLSFDPTGPRLLITTELGDVSIWHVPSGRRVQHLRELGEAFPRVAFSPDGKLAAAAGDEGTVAIWNVESGALKARFTNHRDAILTLAFDNSSRLLVTGGSDGKIVVSDIERGTKLLTLQGAHHPVVDVHFDASANRLVSAALDGAARVWDVATHRRWVSQELGRNCGMNVSLEHNTRYVAISCDKRGTHVWDTALDRLLVELPAATKTEAPYTSAAPALTFEGDLVAIARGSTVEVYEVPSGRLASKVLHAAPVTTVRFASRGHGLISGSSDGTLIVTRDDATIGSVTASAAIDSAALLPNGRAVVATFDQRLTIFEMTRKAEVNVLVLPARVLGMRVSLDGSRLITLPVTSTPASPIVWDLQLSRQVAVLEGHGSQVFCALFVDQERRILTAGTDDTVRRWDARTGVLQQTYFSASRALADVAVSPDGTLVVGAGQDGNLQFWDTSTGTLLWVLPAHKFFISGVHFEGTSLISRGFNGDMARWELPQPSRSADWLDRFDRLVRCAPVRFDAATGGLVTQKPSCSTAQSQSTAAPSSALD